jgi:hypothetical protein
MSTRLSILLLAVVSTSVNAADPPPQAPAPTIPELSEMTPAVRAEHDDMIRRLKAARAQPVPLPRTTPYDNDAKARHEYLTSYAEGYRRVLAGIIIACDGLQTPDGYGHARLAGIRDGEKQSQIDHPEHYRRIMGLTDPISK